MRQRKGLGKGMGTGYKNLAPMDSHIHSLSAKGCKTKMLYAKKNYKYFMKSDVIDLAGKVLDDQATKLDTYSLAEQVLEYFGDNNLNAKARRYTDPISGEKMVDLTPLLMDFAKRETKRFQDQLKKTDKFEMSFDRGEVYEIKVLGENELSTPNDKKYDVVIISQKGEPSRSNWVWKDGKVVEKPFHYDVGYKRSVRAYDLKNKGYYKLKGDI